MESDTEQKSPADRREGRGAAFQGWASACSRRGTR